MTTWQTRVRERLAAWDRDGLPTRLWRKDPTLWSADPVPELADRLGWLDLPASMPRALADIDDFRSAACAEGFRHAVLLGMGGSSLAPEVFQRTFGNRAGHPELIVLDSTHPDAVLATVRRIDPASTLFFVSSKSGTTTETLSFLEFFWQAMRGAPDPGRHFVAITDPGTPLEKTACEYAFRRVFAGPADVGGRFAALSVFGIVPAALVGVDVSSVLAGAAELAAQSRGAASASEDESLELGAALAELALSGRDKLTITTSPSLAALPGWIEQLVAESTGKDGKGILPVVGEPIGAPDLYGDDRVFVHLSLAGDDRGDGRALDALAEAGHPVIRIELATLTDIGREFLRWEIAVATAGAALGIHPFNQPDVQLAKDLAKQAMASAGSVEASEGDDVPVITLDDVGTVLERAGGGGYVAILAYVEPTRRTTERLQAFRIALRDRWRMATTVGYGPRYLHSTGQLHKGGASGGIFILIDDDADEPVAIPDAGYGFGDLIRAQAAGDARALRQRGRTVVRLRLGRDGLAGLAKIAW